MFGGLTEGRSKRLVSVLRPTCAFFRRGNLHINVDQFSSGEEIEKKAGKASKGQPRRRHRTLTFFAALPRLRWATRTSQMARRQHVAVAACLAVFLSGALYVAGGGAAAAARARRLLGQPGAAVAELTLAAKAPADSADFDRLNVLEYAVAPACN